MTESDLDRAMLHLSARLDEAPWCSETRLILADLYEDMGDLDRAAFQRWLVKTGKRPFCPRLEKEKFVGFVSNWINDDNWHWYTGGITKVTHFVYRMRDGTYYWPSREEAEEAAFQEGLWR